MKGTISSKLRKTKHFMFVRELLFLSQLTTTSIYNENSSEKY